MHIGEISFCNRVGSNVKSDEFKKLVLEQIGSYGCRVIQKHHELFVAPTSLDILNANPHMMTLRTNGNPYYLFFTTYAGINQCIFIDKKVQQNYVYPRMVIVKFWMDDALFEGTLFNGEMVHDDTTGDWTFMIHDIMADSGHDTGSVNLVKRINRCYEILSKSWWRDPRQDVCDIRIKRYFQYQQYDEMIEWSKRLPYSCRGVYFKPLFLKFKDILYNFDDTIARKVDKVSSYNNKQFVTKDERDKILAQTQQQAQQEQLQEQQQQQQPQKRTMLVQKTSQPDIYQVFDGEKGNDVGLAFVNNIRVSKMLRTRFERATPIDKIKFTSIFNVKFSKWEPIEEC